MYAARRADYFLLNSVAKVVSVRLRTFYGSAQTIALPLRLRIYHTLAVAIVSFNFLSYFHVHHIGSVYFTFRI